MKNQQQAMEVGTILVSQWGYDQTNVDFYEVVKATKTMVYVQRIEKKCEPVAWLQNGLHADPWGVHRRCYPQEGQELQGRRRPALLIHRNRKL